MTVKQERSRKKRGERDKETNPVPQMIRNLIPELHHPASVPTQHVLFISKMSYLPTFLNMRSGLQASVALEETNSKSSEVGKEEDI